MACCCFSCRCRCTSCWLCLFFFFSRTTLTFPPSTFSFASGRSPQTSRICNALVCISVLNYTRRWRSISNKAIQSEVQLAGTCGYEVLTLDDFARRSFLKVQTLLQVSCCLLASAAAATLVFVVVSVCRAAASAAAAAARHACCVCSSFFFLS